jgi:hypothetical protein
MNQATILPFPRGTTYFQGQTPDANLGKDLEGRLFTILSPEYPGRLLTLRVVRYTGTSDLTVARKICAFASGHLGTKSDGYIAQDGQVGKPIDDAYSVGMTIRPNDLFYVVESGPCTVGKLTGSGMTISAGALVYGDSTGVIDPAASSGHSIGRAIAAASATDSTVLVDVQATFRA